MGEQFFDTKLVRFFSSWKYVNEKYLSQIEELRRKKGEFDCESDYPVLWSTRSKYVLLLTLEDGTQLVYKAPRKLRSPVRYMFRTAPWGSEAVNFQRLSDIGLPLVKLAAAGEKRKFFILKHGFLMTEYAYGFSDGRAFTYKGGLKDAVKLRDEFIRRNFKYLAQMHKAGFIHHGFTPPNLLYKVRTAPDEEGNLLDIKWIDVAGCRKPFFKFMFKKHVARDLSLFFYFFRFSDGEKISYLETYCQHNPGIGMTPVQLLDAIHRNRVR